MPSYYAVFSNRKLDDIAPANAQALSQIGIANLRIDPRDPPHQAGQHDDLPRRAYRRAEACTSFTAEYPGSVAFLGDRLFPGDARFPANVPTGNYLVEVLLIRNGRVVSGQTTPLVIAESGLGADVSEFATNNAALYGLTAVMGAALLGWLASLPFRHV